MKNLEIKFLIALALITFQGYNSSAGQIMAPSRGGALTEMNLENCNSQGTKCLRLRSNRGVIGQISSVVSLTNIQVTVVDRNSSGAKFYSSEKGYLDLDNNQIVLRQPSKNKLTERVFSLTDLSERTYVY